MEEVGVVLVLVATLNWFLLPEMGQAQLRQDYYAGICPDVERIVRGAVKAKVHETSVAVPATLRLFFHDCFVEGCDASILIASTADNTAEKDHSDNLSLAGDGYDTVMRAKAAVDAIPECQNQVSCADILTMATRDVVALAGGPSYAVEMGRLDGLSSTEESVEGKLPRPDFDLEQLTSMFAANGLSLTDLVALSGAHTVGFSHCNQFANRIYNFSTQNQIDPILNKSYAAQLQASCPVNGDPRSAVGMDPITPLVFDNAYYRDLQQGMGLFTSDQVLYRQAKSWRMVNAWAQDTIAFHGAFVAAMTNLGRVGVKTGSQGNIRRDCSVFN